MEFVCQRQARADIPRTSKDTMERRRHVKPPLAADRRGQAPKPQGGASKTPGLRSTISSGTMRTAVLRDKPDSPRDSGEASSFTTYFCRYAGVTVLSAVGKGSRRNIRSEAQALQCPQRAHTEYAPPNGHPRSLPAPSPRWATLIRASAIARMYRYKPKSAARRLR